MCSFLFYLFLFPFIKWEEKTNFYLRIRMGFNSITDANARALKYIYIVRSFFLCLHKIRMIPFMLHDPFFLLLFLLISFYDDFCSWSFYLYSYSDMHGDFRWEMKRYETQQWNGKDKINCSCSFILFIYHTHYFFFSFSLFQFFFMCIQFMILCRLIYYIKRPTNKRENINAAYV